MLALLDLLVQKRDCSYKKNLHFSALRQHHADAADAVELVRAKLKRDQDFVKNQGERASSAKAAMDENKAQADLMNSKKKMKEAAELNQTAERCRMAMTHCEELAEKKGKAIEKHTQELKRLEAQMRKWAKAMEVERADLFNEASAGEAEMKAMHADLQREKEEFLAVRSDATELKVLSSLALLV